MTSLSVVFNAGRPSLARDDLSVLRYSRKFPSSAGAKSAYRNFANNRSVLSYSSNFTCPLPIISSSGGGGGGRRNFKVLGGGGHNEEDKSQPGEGFLRTMRILRYIKYFIVYPGVCLHAASFYLYDIKREILEDDAVMFHERVGASVKLLLTVSEAKLERKELEPEEKAKAYAIHEKVEATVKELLAETHPRFKRA